MCDEKFPLKGVAENEGRRQIRSVSRFCGRRCETDRPPLDLGAAVFHEREDDASEFAEFLMKDVAGRRIAEGCRSGLSWLREVARLWIGRAGADGRERGL